ncbi:TioE family transcriptional regulator [Rhodococcus sp. NCIMB 12038]|uniref:TioE family transcriptional regulator n=1 Tax=Rhodococcus sp. NCIMB 12038 TaxID=933800 RepID=UPI000B3C606B|nr:TioE family transcriptional regulator [Rhodococcus sp. NCIMB 12038]OUS95263.1 transcriptional regulator [Rhodococcus sp. NCIMB 12038]
MQNFRTVDVARRAGCSVQQIRNLERDGVLPPATRTATGYRIYTEVHLQCALAYRELAVAAGPVDAKRIVRSVHTCPASTTVALLDAAHARLHTERAELALAKNAAAVISTEPIDDVRASDWMGVAELAAALGVRLSTLRHWDTEGLVIPDRNAPTGARRYSPSQVRDARIVHQLRKAGYRIAPLRAVMAQLRRPPGSGDIGAALAIRDETLTTRSRALVDATAALAGLLPPSDVSPRATAPPPESRSRR